MESLYHIKTRGSNFCGRYTRPPTVIPKIGKCSDDFSKSSSSDCRDILKEYERWAYFSCKSDNMSEKSASLSTQADSMACNANVLAREPAVDNINFISGQHA